jgi:hypothetical protein
MWWSKIYIYLKRYCGYIAIILGTIILFVLVKNTKDKKDAEEDAEIDAKSNFALGEIKGRLKEKKDITELELKGLQKTNRTFNRQLGSIKKIKDVNERRKRIDSLLKKVPIIILLFALCTCANKTTTTTIYPSFLPPKINTNIYLTLESDELIDEYDLQGSSIYGRISFVNATIELEDGTTLFLEGGFVFDDYETIKFIQYNNERKVYKKQLALMVEAYNDLYDNAQLAEKIWQERLAHYQDENFLSSYECELCAMAGASLCLGVLYSTETIIDN